jgi:hypothetical protein
MKIKLRSITARLMRYIFFTGSTTLCGCWPPPWFRNSAFFWDGVVTLTSNPQSGGPGIALRLTPTLDLSGMGTRNL